MKIRRALMVLAPLMVLLLAALPGFGQVDYSTATLKGTVLDVQGGGVPGATVTITNPATGLSKTQKSGPEGGYQFPLLPVGSYQVEVTATGFDKAVAKDVVLTVGEASVVDIHLTVGASNVVVEVTTAAPLIPTEQVQQANDINQVQVEQLPNVSRTFDTYAQTLPGISNAEAVHESGSQRAIGAFPTNAFTTSGGNGRGGLVTIDGGENDYGSGITRTYHLPVDSIQEFQVNRNGYNAEYGFSYNEAVSIVTKTGTNNYHGMAFGAFRDQNTDAGQFFQPLGPTGNRLFDQDAHVGGNFGGALIKDKLFFFVDYEGYQTAFKSLTNFNNGEFNGITPAQQDFLLVNGPLATCGNLQTGADVGMHECGSGNLTTAQELALTHVLTPANNPFANSLIGAPGNSFHGTVIKNQSGVFTQRDNWNDGVLRFDWQPDSNNSFTVRGLAESQVDPGTFGGAEFGQIANAPPDGAVGLINRDYEVVGSWTHIFSPTMFNALRVQIVPEYVADTPNLTSESGNIVPFNLILDGFGAFGPTLAPVPNYTSQQRRYQFEDSFSLTRGTHSLKFGISYRPAKYAINDGLYQHSQIVYLPNIFPADSVLADLVGGSVGSFDYYTQAGIPEFAPTPVPGNPGAVCANAPGFANGPCINALQAFGLALPVQFRTSFGTAKWSDWGHYGGVYAQDSWKITPRLTVNAGVRFDVNGEPFPNGGSSTFCEPPAGTAVATTVAFTQCTAAGTPGAPAGISRTFTPNPGGEYSAYASPRVGLAFDLTGDHKTVLRASGGMYVGASELQAVYYSNTYNPNGRYLSQAEVTLSPTNPFPFLGLLTQSIKDDHLPVLPPTPADFTKAGFGLGAGQPNAVIITQGDRPCGGGQDPFGCGTYRGSYSTQASLSIQRELMSNTSLEVGYDFQRTFHLQDPLEGNFTTALSQPGDPAGSGKPLIDPFLGPMLVPINPNVETGTIYCSCGDAVYNGVTATLTRRFANHLQFQANYTYSRAIDDVLDFSSFNSSFFPTIFPNGVNIGGHNFGRDRGQSAYNIANIATGNLVYTTPFDSSSSNILEKVLADITLADIVSIHSGIPFEVLINPGQGLGGECTMVATCAAGGATSNGLTQEALNQARPFAAGRNTGIGPWNYRWDMSVRKAIYINKERGLRLEVSANLENLLNKTNFAGVDGVFPGVGTAAAAAAFNLPNGGNLLTGPYNLQGIKKIDVLEKTPVNKGGTGTALGSDPLSFVSADVPRLAQFVLKLSF
jgi:carboxypeptidase family protein